MRRFFQVKTLTLFNWLAFLATGILLLSIYSMQILHPHFLPLTLCLLFQGVVAGGLWIVALQRLFCRKGKLNTLGWLLLGLTPVWAEGAIAARGIWTNRIRVFRDVINRPIVRPAAASLMDLEARFRYPHRVQGKHVVLLTNDTGGAEESVKSMDRHIERMENVLGKTCRARVHWVRGPLLGTSGVSFSGIALGSERPGVNEHEVAHFMIEQLCPPRADPPTILVEGWAESQSENESGLRDERVWRLRKRGHSLSLADLTSSKYYGKNTWRSYDQGGALVEYLLRIYGGEKFLTLYTTCRPQSFAKDIQSVLGVSLDELDRAYWADVEARVNSPEHVSRYHPLVSARVAEGIDRAEWTHVALEHWRAFERAAERYGHARYSMESKRQSGSVTRFKLCKNGSRIRLEQIEEGTSGSVKVCVADPALSFSLSKREVAGKAAPARWTAKERDMIHVMWEINDASYPPLGFCYLSPWANDNNEYLAEKPLITALTKIERDGHLCWRIDYEIMRAGGVRVKWSGSCVLDPARHWTIQSDEMQVIHEGKEPYQRSVSLEYDSDLEDFPVLRSCEISCPEWTPGSMRYEPESWKFMDLDFASTPEAEFKPAAFGVSESQIHPEHTAPWPVQIAVWGTVVMLAGGCSLLAATRQFSKVQKDVASGMLETDR